MQYRYSRTREPRITFASLFLLLVFVAAVAVILAAIVWQPWRDDGATLSAPAIEDVPIEAPAADGDQGESEVLVQPPAE